MPLYASVYVCLVVTCWERADLLALVCGVLLWVCYFHIGILGQVWTLIVSIPDLCTLIYFYTNLNQRYCQNIIPCLVGTFVWYICSHIICSHIYVYNDDQVGKSIRVFDWLFRASWPYDDIICVAYYLFDKEYYAISQTFVP